MRAFALLVLLSASALAETILTGSVSHVRDGDTIVVDGTPIRLNGLHAPEMRDPGGPEARDFMVRLAAGRMVTCALTGARTYDRHVGTCFLDGQDIAATLVAAGLGRDCPRFSEGRYRDVETPAARATMPLPGYCRAR